MIQNGLVSIEDYLGKLCKCIHEVMIDKKVPKAIPCILWGIWKNRNSQVFTGIQGDLDVLVANAVEDAEEWFMLKEEPEEVAPICRVFSVPAMKTLCKPSFGAKKCNINSSWINPQFMCGGAWIVFDHQVVGTGSRTGSAR